MRTPMIAGNWKLHNTLDEARRLATGLVDGCSGLDDREIVIAPAFTALTAVAGILSGSPLQLAAQNCYPEASGAFTGEVSAALLKDAGCAYVILGHSERRQLMGESDGFVRSKVLSALAADLRVILCIGETLQEREAEQMLEVLTRQVREGLAGVPAEQMQHLVIAYEPVWAIGTGKTATPDQAQEAHSFVRGLLQGLYTPEIAAQTRILYGGSVKPDNVDQLMAQADIDGALVGGASLKVDDFLRIIRYQDSASA